MLRQLLAMLKVMSTCHVSPGRPWRVTGPFGAPRGDFFDCDQRVDWIITNPPFSKMRAFLKHGYEIANNVVFLTFTAHVLGMKARLQDMNDAKMGH
jgi:hypothetical protein